MLFQPIQKGRPGLLQYLLAYQTVFVKFLQPQGQYTRCDPVQRLPNFQKSCMVEVQRQQDGDAPHFVGQPSSSDSLLTELNGAGRLAIESSFFGKHIFRQERMSSITRGKMEQQTFFHHLLQVRTEPGRSDVQLVLQGSEPASVPFHRQQDRQCPLPG